MSVWYLTMNLRLVRTSFSDMEDGGGWERFTLQQEWACGEAREWRDVTIVNDRDTEEYKKRQSDLLIRTKK